MGRRTTTLVVFLELSFPVIITHRFTEAPEPLVCASWLERMISEIPLISIVDDDDMVRAATHTFVRSLGFDSRTFASAESFLQSSALLKTRCLILDVQMPNMSGLELQERLSNLGFEIPIIFVTAYPDEAVRHRALQAGAVAFLLKPFEAYGQRFVDCVFKALKEDRRSAP